MTDTPQLSLPDYQPSELNALLVTSCPAVPQPLWPGGWDPTVLLLSVSPQPQLHPSSRTQRARTQGLPSPAWGAGDGGVCQGQLRRSDGASSCRQGGKALQGGTEQHQLPHSHPSSKIGAGGTVPSPAQKRGTPRGPPSLPPSIQITGLGSLPRGGAGGGVGHGHMPAVIYGSTKAVDGSQIQDKVFPGPLEFERSWSASQEGKGLQAPSGLQGPSRAW